MGFVSMRRNFGRHMRTFMWIFLVIFVVGTFFLFGWTGFETGPRGPEHAGGKVVAVVGGQKINRAEFETAFDDLYRAMERAGEASLAQLGDARRELLDALIVERVLLQAATQRGIKVSRRELNEVINAQIEEQTRGVDREFRRLIENSIRRQADRIRSHLLIQKLHDSLVSQVTVTDDGLRDSYREAHLRQIVIHVDEEGQQGLPDAEAKQKAEEALAKLKEGADFAALAAEVSDDQFTSATGGDMGFARRAMLPEELGAAVSALKPGGVSDVIRLPMGYAIVKLEEERLDLPPDFEEKREQYREQYVQQQQARVWEQFMTTARGQATVDLRDPEMRGLQAMAEGKVDEAIQHLQEANRLRADFGDQVQAAILFNLGALHERKQDWKQALAFYDRALDVAGYSLDEIYLALGRAHAGLGDEAEARRYYQATEDEAPENPQVRYGLMSAYLELGDEEAAARQREWLDEFQRKQAEEMRRRFEEQMRTQAEAARRAAGEAPAPDAPACGRPSGGPAPGR